jgi:HrpA-like RNA helicase
MVCADEKLRVGDPRKVLQQCLDPPERDVIEDAIEYLTEIGACHKAEATRHEEKIVPTDYGNLMAALPLSVTEARIILEGGRIGLLNETLALMAIYNHRPAPIVHHFSDTDRNQDILESFYPEVQANSTPSVALANLSAYLYWDYHWNRRQNDKNLGKYKRISRESHISHDAWKWSPELDAEHTVWCRNNDVNPTSMR